MEAVTKKKKQTRRLPIRYGQFVLRPETDLPAALKTRTLVPCPDCEGKGHRSLTCGHCEGAGLIPKEKS